MGSMKKKKTSFMKMIIKSYIMLGISMFLFSGILLLSLAEMEHRGLFQVDIFPTIELAILVFYIAFLLFLIFMISYFTAGRIRKKGQILLDAVDKIGKQKLDFKVEHTGIMEIDQVLSSMNDMKIALSDSLDAQWKLEQNKQRQLSALVHDLKAPITIIKGNIYLLNYETLSQEGKKSLEDMNSCVSDMEYHMAKLLETSGHVVQQSIDLEICDLKKLVDDVLSSMQILFQQKEISLKKQMESVSVFVSGNQHEMKRAIQNVVSNAVDFTPEGSSIYVELKQEDAIAELSVTDSGNGFSKQALNYAKEQFYMEDSSRSRKKHYGLGLSITDHIIRMYDGNVLIMNDCITGGGKVIMQLPVVKE